MSAWDPFELAALPLSAYTPGQGDPKMEGGKLDALGNPVYTFEQYLKGDAPYVTGATSRKNPSGQLIFRSLGDQRVPVRITDYGPGVKGVDIATSNKKWATQFPYQGATDTFTPPNAAGPDSGRPLPINQGVLAQFAVRNYGPQTPGSSALAEAAGGPSTTPGRFDFINDYYKTQNAGKQGAGILGGALSAFGGSMQKQGQQGMQQAMAMLRQRPSSISALLDQLAANPTMYL